MLGNFLWSMYLYNFNVYMYDIYFLHVKSHTLTTLYWVLEYRYGNFHMLMF